MKPEIHPDYHKVLFVDSATGAEWISRSTLTSKETREVDGEEVPVVKLEISNVSHPFWTGKMRELDSDGRVDRFRKRYGQPNDLLVRLNIFDFRVRDVTIRPVYGVGEKSGIKPLRMIPRLSWLMFRLFLYRMGMKYVIRDFHPLLFFYAIGLVLFPTGMLFGLYLLAVRIFSGPVAGTSALFAALMVITGLQFLLFAMWFDMDHNKELK